MSIPADYSAKQDVLFTNPITTHHHPQHHQISPTIFVCVPNHHTTSDNQSHLNIEIIDISDDDEEDENTRKNGTSIDDSTDEEEIEVIQLSDDDEVNNESSNLTLNKHNKITQFNNDFDESSLDSTHKSAQRAKSLGLYCSECFQLIETKSKLEKHFKVVHGNQMPFKCMLRGCYGKFSDRFLLLQHYTDHSKCTQIKWICSAFDCQFETSTQRNFSNHVHQYHDIGLFQCAQCLETYPNRFMVNKHVREAHKHSQERATKRFRCHYKSCQFMSKGQFYLTHHQLTHTQLRPFWCCWPACDYSGRYRTNVIQHVRLRHLRIPATVKETVRKNIQDKDPHQFVRQIPYSDLKEAVRQELSINVESEKDVN